MVSIHGFRPLPCLKPGHRRYVYVLLKECASFAQRLLSVRGIDGEGKASARMLRVDRHGGSVFSESFHEVERLIFVKVRLEVKGNLPFS